jgi:hypothetical protein
MSTNFPLFYRLTPLGPVSDRTIPEASRRPRSAHITHSAIPSGVAILGIIGILDAAGSALCTMVCDRLIERASWELQCTNARCATRHGTIGLREDPAGDRC